MQPQTRTIFTIDKYRLMPCLPLKTGTTNWQRSLISLLYTRNDVPVLDPNDVEVVSLGYIMHNMIYKFLIIL